MELDGCPFPDDRLYDVDQDVWVGPAEGDGARRLGILSTLASFAGRFTQVTFRPLEPTVAAGRSIATLESVRFTGAVRLPFSAELIERNEEVVRRPKLLNDAPYADGWVVRVRPLEAVPASPRLRSPADARELLRSKIVELRIRCYPAVPDTELYEIGAECSAILARLDQELDGRAAGDVLLLVTDDPTSPIEMVRWTDRTGHTVLDRRREGTLEHFLVRREPDPRPRRPPR